MKMPPGWTFDRLEQTVKNCMFGLDNTGICIECGADREGCEPDAENYECYECGEMKVYGAEGLYMILA